MSDTTLDHQGAVSAEVLALHLQYMRRDLDTLVKASSSMATKQDIEELEERMSGFATKRELEALETRLQKESLGSTFDRWLSLITRVGTAATVIAAATAAIIAAVRFWDSLKAVVPH